jgi:UDP-glucose 4-epimerase
MRVLVTGAAGFIGTNLCTLLLGDGLLDEGVEVVAVDNLSAETGQLAPGVELHEVSCAELAESGELLREIDAVVHLAGKPSVDFANDHPMEAFDANVRDTVALLIAAAEAGVGRFVYASSNAAAGNVDGPVHEQVLTRPASLYGASKLAAEAYCIAAGESYGIETVALRFSSVYGPHSRHKGSVIHKFIRDVIAGRILIVHGDGEQSRDFIFVEDLCRAVVAATRQPCAPVLQIGTGERVSVNELIDVIADIADAHPEIEHGETRLGDVRESVSDISLAREQLGWEPRVDLREGVRRTYEYYRAREAAPGEQLAGEREGAAT